ncbi:RecQ family ATP-dependent DNA helicase [Tundrisphaera sp. TA3]|uniref:RecQ family ATP-dependent DNA helicase n=1 Tax=Tundrisphaera sp. TA3 TaxID=3435775 RepID=UPI003EB7D081
MSMADVAADLERPLRDRFGLERFRPGQREVIENVLGGRDVLCVMPTGGGKSLCYQLPAVLLRGPTLVVSPLIALMKDQVDALQARGLRATLLNSTLDPAEQKARLAEIEAGLHDLVYVAPERFRSPRFVETMARVKPALLAVDEAHCISEWGHDFRPDYARIGYARRQIGSPPCIALTATATDLVRRDIADQLDLRDPAQFVTGFDRPNLTYAVVKATKDADKLAVLASTLQRMPGPAVVYASSRARCETVGQYLERELRRPTVVYHAGLSREERASAQDRFMSGEVETVVATNAFGMGVDKADIRSVVHFNLPGTLEAYYQEAGRAGRDGNRARCVLLYAPQDRFLQEMFIENEYPPPDAVYRVYDFLRGLDADPIELTHAEIKESSRVDLNESAIGTALKILEGAGAVERFRPRENMAIVRINAEPDEPSLIGRVSPSATVQLLALRGIEGIVNRRFGEAVYFNPDEFAGKLGIERSALTRAIKNLAADLPIDYVPPFRGNAVRVNDRNKRSRDLVIDFKALDQRKKREYDKLERMLRYAQTNACRRAYILGYFGDAEASTCGSCDNCGTSGDDDHPDVPTSRQIDTESGREIILKALSGVARARGRFGKIMVAQMLTGSSSEKMTRAGLASLTTFGILGAFRQPEVVALLDALAGSGLVQFEEFERFRATISLTPEGRDYLKGPDRPPVSLTLPDDLFAKVQGGGMGRTASSRPSSSSGSKPGEPDIEAAPSEYASDPLWTVLREMRNRWAAEVKQPRYTIFSDMTLEAMVRARPRTPHELAAIKGMGPYKLERYGAALIAAITGEAESATPPPASPQTKPTPAPAPIPIDDLPSIGPDDLESEERGETKPTPAPAARAETKPKPARKATTPGRPQVSTEEWTWRLLDRGFAPDEVAAIRGLDFSDVVRHATRVARLGKPVAITAFLTPEVIAHWDEAVRGGAARGPEPSPGLWALYMACRGEAG